MPPEAAPASQEVTDTNDGFIVGTDPKESPRTAEQWASVQAENNGRPPAQQQAAPANGTATEERVYTEADLERVRREEKDKLYGRIESMDEQLKRLQSERDEREAARQAELDAAAELARQKEEEEMDVRTLLQRKEEEWSARLAEVEDRYDQDRAVFERERRFQELEAYRVARVDQESEWIIPELRDLVKGNSETDIDASIEEMKARSQAILGQFESVAVAQRQGMRGTAPTAPPVGPMEQMETYESLTAQDIASMDMETYKKYRSGLLQASGAAYRRG